MVSYHRRDYIFSVGITADGFVMTASNNAPGWPTNPARNPVEIETSGWYTFKHTFMNVEGVLSVYMEVIDSDGTTLGDWTLSDPTDEINTFVGGNSYGWFAYQELEELAIDNSELALPDTTPTIDEAKDEIDENVDHKGTANSLKVKLDAAAKQFEKGNEKAGINVLNAFINHVEAQKGKHIDEDFADQLIEWANAWIEDPSLAL